MPRFTDDLQVTLYALDIYILTTAQGMTPTSTSAWRPLRVWARPAPPWRK